MSESHENSFTPDFSEGVKPVPEIVGLEQPFYLFQPERTVTIVSESEEKEHKGVPEFDSEIALDANGLVPLIPFSISSLDIYKNSSQAFTPFIPDDGYQVTIEDFNATTRTNKKYENSQQMGDIKSSPLELSLFASRDKLHDAGVVDDEYRFTPEAMTLLQRLRFCATFPNGLRFESRPQLDVYDEGNIQFFGAFYPVDTGPLAEPFSGFLKDRGLQIALPADPRLLQTIQGEFYLSPEMLHQ